MSGCCPSNTTDANQEPNVPTFYASCKPFAEALVIAAIEIGELALLVISCVQMASPFLSQTAFIVTTLAVGTSSVLVRMGCAHPRPRSITHLGKGDRGVFLLVKLSSAIFASLAIVTFAGKLTLPDLTLSVVILSSVSYGARGLWYVYGLGFLRGRQEPKEVDEEGQLPQDIDIGNDVSSDHSLVGGGHAHGGDAHPHAA